MILEIGFEPRGGEMVTDAIMQGIGRLLKAREEHVVVRGTVIDLTDDDLTNGQIAGKADTLPKGTIRFATRTSEDDPDHIDLIFLGDVSSTTIRLSKLDALRLAGAIEGSVGP